MNDELGQHMNLSLGTSHVTPASHVTFSNMTSPVVSYSPAVSAIVTGVLVVNAVVSLLLNMLLILVIQVKLTGTRPKSSLVLDRS